MTDPLEIRLESGAFPTEDVHVYEVSGREAISRCFRFEIDVALPAPHELAIEALIGAPASLTFSEGGALRRRVHGMIAEVEDRLEIEADHRTYRLVLVPRADRLSLVATQEIFLDVSVPDLIAKKLAHVALEGDDHVARRLIGGYGKRQLVAQFKETDLALVSRLAEHLGIFFFFEHEGDADRIVFGDSNSAFRKVPGKDHIAFRPRGEEREIYRIDARARMTPAAYVVQDYNYRTPLVDLVASYEAPWGHAGGVVEYAPHHRTPDEGSAIARIRAEERRVADAYFTGESALPELVAGATFAFEGHERLGDRDLLLVEVEHSAVQPVLFWSRSNDERHYRNTFRAIDATVPYRPPRVTPRPRIHGLLTGVVEPRPDGKLGTIADIDDEGRYTVRLLFDASPFGERPSSSHRVRMIQLHAGPDYGVHFPLKAGVEVLLAFLDGDPDRPLIVGCAPNPVTPSPVVGEHALFHRIKTATGVLIEMKDDY